MSNASLASSEEIEAATQGIGRAAKTSKPRDYKFFDDDPWNPYRRCRLRKLRCDGQRPCAICVRTKFVCSGDSESSSNMENIEKARRLLGLSSSSKIEHPNAPIKPPLHAQKDASLDLQFPDTCDAARFDRENLSPLAYRTLQRGYVTNLEARLKATERKLLESGLLDSSTSDSLHCPPSPARESQLLERPGTRSSSLHLTLAGAMLTPVADDEPPSDLEDESEVSEHGFEPPFQSRPQYNAKNAHQTARKTAMHQTRRSERNDLQQATPKSQGPTNVSKYVKGKQSLEALPSTQAKQHSPPAGSPTYRSSSESEISFVRDRDQSHYMEWSDKQWNEPTQAFIEVFALKLVQEYMVVAKNSKEKASDVSTARTTSTSKSTTTAGSSTDAPSSRKRPHRDQDKSQDAEEDEEDDGRSPGSKRSRGSDEPAKLFACPYAKYDPSRYSEQNQEEKNYRGCASKYLNSVSRVKQHLYRVHARPHWYCGNCYVEFPARERLNDHHRQRPPCDARPARFDEMMTDEQYTQIKRKGSGKTPRDAWYSIFHILFPGNEPPLSPYVSTSNPETLRHFVTFFRAYGPIALSNLMREGAERNGGPVALEASTQMVVDEAFEIALPEVLRQRHDSALDMHIENAERESGSGWSVIDADEFDLDLWISGKPVTTASAMPLSLSPGHGDENIPSWARMKPVPALASAPVHADFETCYALIDADDDANALPVAEAADGAFDDLSGNDWHQSGW